MSHDTSCIFRRLIDVISNICSPQVAQNIAIDQTRAMALDATCKTIVARKFTVTWIPYVPCSIERSCRPPKIHPNRLSRFYRSGAERFRVHARPAGRDLQSPGREDTPPVEPYPAPSALLVVYSSVSLTCAYCVGGALHMHAGVLGRARVDVLTVRIGGVRRRLLTAEAVSLH